MEQNDVAPELLDRLRKDFDNRMAENQKLAGLYEKVNAGNATYLEVNDFALEAGNILADVFQDNISESILPDGRMYFNIADRVIRPMMVNNYDIISSVCMNVQGRLNQKAMIGLKAIKPELNEDKVRGIINKVSSAGRYGDVAWVLVDPMRTFSQSVVDDSIRANVEFQGKAGLYPRIERIAAAGCCEWCEEVSGTYRYPDVPKDVYRRHGHCRCMVEYDPANGRGQRQNVHDKRWHNSADDDIIKRRRTIGLDDSDQNSKIEYRKKIGLNDSDQKARIEYRKSCGQYGLTYDESKAITDYFSSQSYVINEKLRNETELTGDDKIFCVNLDNALKKIPTYSGNLSRSLYFMSEEDIISFVDGFQEGKQTVFMEYISTTKGAELYNPEGQVQIFIRNASKGHDVERLKKEEMEVLYERKSAFVTEKKVYHNGVWYILVEET